MAPVYKPLDEKSIKMLKKMAKAVYLDGECYAFAIALSRGLGWPMVALVQAPLGTLRHAAAYGPDHRLYDARGSFTQDDPAFGEPFGFVAPYAPRHVTEANLRAVRPVNERSVARAGEFAEAIWPDLPWLSSRKRRAMDFLLELEGLCRKHQFWIRSPFPAGRPVLCDGVGDEAGYTLQHTAEAGSFFIDRRLGE